ncbi:DUF5684 domain-containing protein [Microbacterium sp. ZW T2_14]|uniref:DUF5684 domain-containing protein n=1 Tax=Microbacterium sp. ZW T2_14 TaxID=3378079 RepID=UPI003852571B
MNATDVTAAVFGSLFSLLLAAGVYVWIALALSAVFRKAGVESWKAWVPILNSIVLLQLAGLSPWLLLLALVPIVQIAVLVVFVIAIHRVSTAFGFGVGMTVLGAVLFPVWASVIGWGSARWVGRDEGAGPRRAAEPDGLRPLPPFPTPVSRSGESAVFPQAAAPSPVVSDFAPPAHAPAARQTMPAPTEPAVPGAPDEAAAAGAPILVPPPGGWTPPPLPGRPVPATANSAAPSEEEPAVEASPDSGEADPWQGFVLDTTDHSAEVTGAFPGAAAPVSAVPAPAVSPVPAAPVAADAPEAYAPRRSAAAPVDDITRPPVTDVPLPAVTGENREPWAPARSPMAEVDAFPEASGPVSAVAGAAGAGAPFSALSSVSARHARPELPDEDMLDETVIVRRKRTDWTLLPPTGDPVALASDVVILGRRPTSDPQFPGAQLVSISDGTVSKTHARLQLRDDRWYVTDLDSTNGVLFATVMGTEVEATPGVEIEAGDRFLLGDAEVRLQRSDG